MLTLIKCRGALEHLFFSLSLPPLFFLSLFFLHPWRGSRDRRAFNGRPHHDNPASLRESQRTTGGKTCLCLTSTRVTDRGTDGLRDGGSAALLQFMADNEEKLLNCCFCILFYFRTFQFSRVSFWHSSEANSDWRHICFTSSEDADWLVYTKTGLKESGLEVFKMGLQIAVLWICTVLFFF